MATKAPLQSIWRVFLASWRPLKNGSGFKHLHMSRNILSNGLEGNSTDVKTPFSDVSSVNIAAMEAGVTKYYRNRNPRSLELLGIAEKPKGFGTKGHRVDYYHRLLVEKSSRHFTAFVHHNDGNRVVEASTKEFCISRHLYKTCDCSAAYNIGRVIAFRCKNAGLNRVMWEHKWDREHAKIKAFVSGLKKEGLILNEPKPRKTFPEPDKMPRY